MAQENPSTSKAPPVAKHDSAVLDLAFAMDCTGSMASYIQSAQQNIRTIVEGIVAKEKSNIHLALVEYRDHPPEDTSFITKPHDFTASVATMKQWLDGCSAAGGGDTPEAVADALHDVLKLSWRPEATKICVLIADTPPHGLMQHGDSFPAGCPAGLDPMTLVRQMAEKGITLYTVGCEPSITPYRDFFAALAHLTGGQYVPLRNARALTQVIIGGAQEELSLEQLMNEANEVLAEVLDRGGEVLDRGGDALDRGEANVDEEVLSKKVFNNLKAKKVRVQQLQCDNRSLPTLNEQAIRYSSHTNMAQLKAAFSPVKEDVSSYAAPPSVPPRLSLKDLPAPPLSDDEGIYSVVEVDIDYDQAQRLVKKSMARNKLAK